jgi:TIR domain
MMATKVFISYRRDDSAGHAGRVHDRLEREFGRDLLFMDVDAVPLGVNFVKVLGEEVAKCNVLLAVIGPNWLNARDEDGNRRLDNPHDFVRIEIGAALQRNIPVIPILLDGAKVPKANQLPKELEEFPLRNGLDIRHASFHNDVDRLIRGLKQIFADTAAETEASKQDAELQTQLRKVEADIQAAEKQIQERQAEIRNMEAHVTALRAQVAEMKQKVATGEAGETELHRVFEMMRRENKDYEAAIRIADDNQKQQIERWKILQDTQTKIFEIQRDVAANRAQTIDKAYKKWDEYIRA